MMLMAAAITAQAQQETVFEQDFEDLESVEEQQWGGVDVDGDEVTFGLIQTQPVLVQLGFTGNVMGSSNFYLDDENNPVEVEGSDNMLLAPIVTLPDNDNLSLSLRLCGIATADENDYAGYSIYIIDALEFENAETIEDLIAVVDAATPIVEDTMNGMSEVVSYDISAYQGQTVLIFIRHSESSGTTYLFADDIAVTSGLLATDKALAGSFSIYPNPAVDVINITNTIDADISAITLTDVNGKTVRTATGSVQENTILNVDGLSAGSYFLSIATNKGNVIKQIIKK